MSNLTMQDAKHLYMQTMSKSKVIKIADVEIEVTPILSAEDVCDFVYRVMSILASTLTSENQPVNIDWIIRAVTIIKYTNFKFEDVHQQEDIRGLTELLFGTPLFAMLVGSPERPIYFNNVAYTTPAVDIEQYHAIISTVENTMSKCIHWSYFNNKEEEKNEEAQTTD